MTGAREAPVAFNPFDPSFFADPYAQYAALREQDPVHETPLGAWALFRYDDCVRLLRDPALSVDDSHALPTLRNQMLDEMGVRERENEARSMLFVDPPDHTRLRRLVSKAFTPKMVEELRARARALVDEHLDAVARRGEMDVIADLAFPLPFTVISEMLGMPTGRRDELRGWSTVLGKTLDPILTPDDVRAAQAGAEAMIEHVTEVIAVKRREPADDLLSAMIAAEDDGDVLTEDELVAQVMLLYIAGHETTVNLIGNGTYALLRHRDQFERLVADPDLDVNAIEELLRYDSPVQFSRRIPLADVEYGDRTIPAGMFVLTCLASANRDPAHWGEDADTLDLGREHARAHVSFGSGIHHCLGASLARMEGQEAIGRLVRRFPDMALAIDEPTWNGRIVLRGLDSLPVTLN